MAQTKNLYELPVAEESITSTVEDNESHQGSYKGSVDFAVPLGTVVLAAADGVVTRVRDDSATYGQDRSYGQKVNYITIEHSGSELSEYLHLAKGSACVKLGENVIRGQRLAVTGLSGWLYAPHLHFMVYSKSKDFHCLDIRFS